MDMWVKTACGATTCVGEISDPETISVTLTAGTTYFLFLRYSYPDDSSPITVSVSSP
ncbi:MAG: hypothetical protein JNM69_17150 [Archangium sp.]|nr:hypothetical protein [Archangium sp.]